MPGTSPTPTLSHLEAEIQRLIDEREALELQRQRLRVEELKTLADAYARKLQAAGFSISEGLAALKPYAHVRMQSETAAPATSSSPLAPREPREPRAPRASVTHGLDALHSRAAQVLGEDAHRWLRRAHPLLGGQAPLQIASTPQGVEKVQALLAAYARGA